MLQIDAPTRQFVVYQQQQVIKRLPIRGLVGQRMSFTHWIEQLIQEARREQRQRWQHRQRARAGTSPADTMS
jgi:hypothetical protein